MKVHVSVVSTLVMAWGLSGLAQDRPPTLVIEGADGVAKAECLPVTAVTVEARILGPVAETRITMVFSNPHDRALAGDLYFPLPEGAMVSGYALDIEGVMVDGVAVEKDKGRQVFEKIVRQGVDPGLAEWSKVNNFKTRVFPIPARGKRAVMVRYVTDVVESDGGPVCQLPPRFSNELDTFLIRVEVAKSASKPEIRRGHLANFEVSVPRAGILWDASGSRGAADHAREFKILREFFQAHKDVEVSLVLARNTAGEPRAFTVRGGDCRELIAALESVAYDGGTQMASLGMPKDGPPPDFLIVFTDGLSNFGAEEAANLPRPLYILSDDATANHSFLHCLAATSGGEHLNLKRMTDAEAVAAIGGCSFGFMTARLRPEASR